MATATLDSGALCLHDRNYSAMKRQITESSHKDRIGKIEAPEKGWEQEVVWEIQWSNLSRIKYTI